MACIGLVSICLALAGCSLFGKKSAKAPDAPPRSPGKADGVANAGLTGTASTGPAGGPRLNGLLAGQVVDSYGNARAQTYVRVILTREGNEAKAAPIEQEVAVDAQGYFTIQNLEAGRNYQLIARAPEGDHLVAGVAWSRPPNPRVLIYMSEDYASASTPPVPPLPSWPNKDKEKDKAVPSSGSNAVPAAALDRPSGSGHETPAGPAPSGRGVQIGTPIQSGAAPPPPQTSPNTPLTAAPGSNFVNIPGPGAASAGSTIPTIVTPPSVPQPQGPFCSVRNNRLENLTLREPNGNVWDFRRDHYGKLFLLVFWHTSCVPCKNAVRSLNSWQQMYRPYGLEVVAIAEEDALSFSEKVQRINTVANAYTSNGFKYRILVSDITSCPAQPQFQVRSYPTFILMDGTGQILSRSEGLDPRLEQDIRSRLGFR
jgi:thiol-disulfide isomerase/thioredoxin